MLDETTFGSRKSAITLVEILNEYDNPTYNRRVTNFLIKKQSTSACFGKHSGTHRKIGAGFYAHHSREWLEASEYDVARQSVVICQKT